MMPNFGSSRLLGVIGTLFSFQICCLVNLKVFGHVNAMQSISLGQGPGTQEKYLEESRYYVMGFDHETLQRYAKLKSEEAVNLIEKHCCALLGNEQTGMLETRGMILTSFLRAKRLVLEAVAIGSFVWDIEQYVDTLYKL